MTKRSKKHAGNRTSKHSSQAPHGEAALRIVSLAPSATSILCAIGARRALVGVTKWCAEVVDVSDLPQLGDCWQMENVDEILRLRPTLVIGSVPFKKETVAKLLEQPLNFLAKNPRSLADIERDILLLGRIAARAAAAERLIAKMHREFNSIRRNALHAKRTPRVYCEAWPNPRISSPPWVAELVHIAGGEFVVPAGEKIADAQVAQARPDVIVLAWAATGAKADPKKTYAIEAWKGVPAIQNHRVHIISDELLNTPGPPLIQGARQLFRILHGGASTKVRW
jgi:ABC-type Fe3+-hydroxamate transport system substrate-binding protein